MIKVTLVASDSSGTKWVVDAEMDIVPRKGDTVLVGEDLEGDVYAVIWEIKSNGKPGDHTVEVRLR